MNKFKEKGITLISLIITIIIILILAVIVVNLVLGEKGILNIAKKAEKNYVNAEEKELKDLENLYSSIQIATNDNSQITISIEDLNKIIDDRINKASVTTVPEGTIISYMAGSNAPNGYLICDGSVYNISEYSKLAQAIYDGFGRYDYYGGDGTSTFAVPDLRGEFLRGTGTNSHAYSGSGENVGVHQAPTLQAYCFSDGSNITVSGNVANTDWVGVAYSSDTYKYVGATTANFAKNRFSVRPTNTSVLYCIKY